MTELAPRVSVVVPVFDPGPYIEPAIRSILGQTMPAADLEAIFIDDGSTDGTSARLDRLAAEYPATIRVIHIEPSGAPGRPRNVGIEAARGDYIQFLDADDELALDALEHLVKTADRNASDIVVEKFASASIPRSQRLFERSVERTTLVEMPALVDSSLGPAKLYRRALLLDNGIRFPEGWRQMEDQLFTLHAYARAGSISISADRPWYFYNRRDDGGHLTSERVDPDRHFRNLRTVLDMVEAQVGPGEVRDRIVRRMLRIELLNRVSEPGYPQLAEAERARLFTGARDLLRERIDPAVIDGLGTVRRHRCELVRDDRAEDLLAMARELADLELSARIDRVEWDAGVLRLSMTAGLVFASSDEPLDLARPYTAGGDAGLTRIQLILRSRPSVLEWYVKAPGEPLQDRIGSIARARIDPMRVGAGSAPIGQGSWDVFIRLSGLGIERMVALGEATSATVTATLTPALIGDPARVIVPVIESGGLRLEVDPRPAVLAAALGARPILVVRDGERLSFRIPMVAGPDAGSLTAAVVVAAPDGDRVVPATVKPRRGGVVLASTLPALTDLPAGRYPVSLRLGGGGEEGYVDVPLGTGVVSGHAGLRIEGLGRVSLVAVAVDIVRWSTAQTAASTHRVARRVKRRVRPRE